MNPLLRCAAARDDMAKRDSNICVLKKGYVGQKSANDAEIDDKQMIYSPETESKSFITSNNSDVLEQRSKTTLIKLSFIFFKSLRTRSALGIQGDVI